MEVNASFYRLPRRDSVARWVDATPDEFMFSVKVSRYITHVKRLRETGRHIALLLDRIEPLARLAEARAVALAASRPRSTATTSGWRRRSPSSRRDSVTRSSSGTRAGSPTT